MADEPTTGETADELLDRALDDADPDVAAAAVDAWRGIAGATAADDPGFADVLRNLALALRNRLELTGDLDDLDALIEVDARIVEATPAGDPGRPEAMFDLAAARYARSEFSADPGDGVAALWQMLEVVREIDRDAPVRPEMLAAVATIGLMRYHNISQAIDDLDVAIAAGREAVDSGADGDLARAGTLTNLGAALRNRFERTEERADLDAAIEVSGQAVAATAEEDPAWATAMFNLGAALHIRHERAGARPEDLDAAVRALRQAVDAAPEGHSTHVMALSSLGLALHSRYHRSHDPDDLDTAVEAAWQAVTDLPEDDPDGERYQRNLDIILSTRAAEGYGRAVRLRTEDRLDDADAAYTGVVAEFAEHPEPGLRYWAALALYDQVALLLDTPDEEAARQVPDLVAALRDGFAGSEDPWLQRRVRVAMGAEVELFERLGRNEEARASRARLHELLRPAAELVVALLAEEDSEPVVPEQAPRCPSSLSDQVMRLLEGLDASLDLVRELTEADTGDLLGLVCPDPALFSLAAMKIFTAVKDDRIPGALGDEDRERVDRGLTALASVFRFLHDRPGAYPLGDGPIETLLNAVDVTVSMADALEHARSPGVVQSLSMPYAQALAESSMALLTDGEWRRAWRLHQLLLAAAERLPDSVDGRAAVAMVRFRWLFVARQVLVHLPDGRVLSSAADAGERLLAAFSAGADTEPGAQAEVLLALAGLYVIPYNRIGSSGPDTVNLSELRRWLDRIDEEVLDPVELPEGADSQLPGITEALETGEGYLRRALELAEPEQAGHVFEMMLNVRNTRVHLGEDINRSEYAGIAARAVETVDAEAYPQLLAQALLAQQAAGGEPDQAALDRLLARPLPEIAERAGRDAAAGVLVSLGQILHHRDPAAGRRLFAQAREFVRGLSERDRMRVLLVHQDLLLDPADLEPGESGESGPTSDPEDAVAGLLARARSAGWAPERTAVALLTLAGLGYARTGDPDREVAWLRGLDRLPRLSPEFAAEHTDALAFLRAGWQATAAFRAHERGDWRHALLAQAAACAEYLALPAPDAAMESLTLIAKAVAEARGAGLAAAAAQALAPLIVPAENLIGAPATEVLQRIWSQVIGAVEHEDDAPALVACMQLAKGARFVDALHAGIAFDAGADEEAAGLLAAIAQVEAPAEPDADLDAATLVAPYTEQLDPLGGLSLAQQRENLQRALDALVQRRLTAPQAGRPQLLDVGTMLGLLPPQTVLLWSYLARSPDGGRRLVSLVASGQRLAVVPWPVLDAEHADGHELRVGDRVRLVDPLGVSVAWMRQVAEADPGPVRPVDRSGEWAFADGLAAIYGPVADLLREEHAAGRRHLVVVPHGSLHFAPLHLLYLDGRPLADTWTVTYLPNLALLERLASPVRDRPETARTASVGIGFADGPLAPIPDAVDEAEAVAAEFGVPALTDTRATRDAVLAALSSARLFHIATHGVHNVAAPAFQCLHAADAPVSAHELLRLDLSDLDLITLSACETALGRFDAADNLRGIPAYLLLRGAAAIVGTLWPVESRTSRDFFTALYRELRGGASRLDAFTAAQRQTRAAHPQYRDWGAFYYTGDWR